MIKVTELTYSKNDFKDILRTVTPIQDDIKKMDLDPFPNTADLAIFANKAYSDKDDELRSGLPEGWELLTAVDGSKGYFGCLYFNPSRQQVVLAHRGTVPLVLGTVYADLKSVVLNKYTDYMFSAITLGDNIKREILELNKQNGVRFTLTITGHSLGGWISQVTTITLKHLKRQGNVFVRVSNIDEGIHAHTVVFDSPGVQDMAIKIQRDYGRYDSTTYSMFRSLDISTFFMAVNMVNAAGFHVGDMYLISSNLIFTPGYKNFLAKYFTLNSNTHSMLHFTKAFEAGNVQLLQVKDWPQGWGERVPVHELEKAQGTYYPETETRPFVLHYNIGEEDPGTTVGFHRFSEVELDFVNLISMVRRHEIPGSKIETFFGAKFQDLFPYFTINRKEKTVTLDNESNLKKFFNNIKNSLRWFSGELQVVMEEQKKLTLPRFLLDMYSQEYVDSIPDLPDCEDPFGLCEFTNNRNAARVLYVQAADCSLEMARIYNILYSNYPDIDECIFVNWESLLRLKKHFTTKGLPLNNNCNLFVINIGSSTEVMQVKDILKNIFSNFKEHSKKKAVIVSQINTDLFRFVKSFDPELAISAQECLEFTFNDLKDKSRRELLSKEFIILGQQAMSLNTLLGENCQSSVSIDDVLKPFLKDVLMDKDFILKVPNNLLKFYQLDVMFLKINREADKASLSKLLLEETCSLFVSSNVRQLLEPQLQEVMGVAERVLYISGSSEEDFRQACLENSSINVAYWLAATDGRFFLKEVYNRSFYLPRRFRNQSLVDLKKLVQKQNDVDLFTFVGVTDKATLMHYLNASPEVEKLFSTNLKFKCFQNSTMAENAEEIDRYVNKHTIEVVKEGEGYLLVWRDSQRALDSLLPCLSSRLLSEEELCACKTVIVSDLPGMGKSTTLTSLSRHLVDSWVFRINLRDHPADIKNLPEQMSVESVAHFLAGASSEPATLNLLRFCLRSQGSLQIVVLLDGFDEIRDEEAVEKILKLCHFLKNETTAKLIVTTRDTYKDVLVNRLSTVPTKFEEITKEIQLNFLVDFWHSHAVLGQKVKRLRLFAQHLYEAAHEKLGRDVIGLIGIPLHMRMLAEAFLQQAEEFIDDAKPLPDIIGINNIYSLYKKFTSVKRDIFLKEKISFFSYDSNTLCETLIVNHYVLAFEILDPEFQKKYLLTDGINHNEMNRFGLTQWKPETHCDFIHRTFAEYFCSQLLILWLRRDNFRYMHLPIEKWFLSNLLIKQNFKVVRKFMDEHLAEVTLAEGSKQLLYDNMCKCWSKNTEAFHDAYDRKALLVAVEEGNTNIIELLLGGLATEQTREPFESFLLARDYDGNTALKTSLKSLHEDGRFGFGIILPIAKGIKQLLKIAHFSYELKYKLLLYTLFHHDWPPGYAEILLTCALNEKGQEDIQKALNRIEVLRNEVYSEVPLGWHEEQAIPIFIKNFILNEQNDIAERKFLPLAQIYGETAVNVEARVGNYELVKQFIQINHDVVNSEDYNHMTPLLCAAKGDHIELVKFLQQHGARLNAINEDGYTALCFAAENGNLDIVKYLLKHGADTTYKNSIKLLRCAIDGNNMDVIHLISSKENIDQEDGEDKTPLHYAIDRRKWAIAKYLLDSGADPNTLDENDMTPLMSAVSKDLMSLNGTTDLTEVNQRMEILQILISMSKDNNKPDSDGRTLLHHAIRGGDKAVVKYLVSEVKVDVNCSDKDGKTPLHYAIEGGHEEIVKYLISEVKVDINCLDNEGKTPLYYATARGHEEIVKYLVSEVKVNVNRLDNDGMTPLYYAIEGGHEEIVKYLISEVKVDINCSDQIGRTPLHYAIKRGHVAIVKYLISEVKVNINCLDNYRRTSLHYAIEGKHEEIVKYLISEVKVDINCLDHFGMTPLHYAIKRGHVAIVKYLISEVKVDINCLDHFGMTPLHYAIKRGHVAIVKYLISEVKVDINCLDHFGMTPLHYAIKRGHVAIVKYLISEAKVDINCLDNGGRTPLHYAIEEGHEEIVKYLVSEVKVDVDCLDYDGRTPLHCAIEGEHEEIVKYLISEVKVDINCSDNEGRTPLHYAIQEGHEEIVKYLVSEVKVDVDCLDFRGRTPLHYAIEGEHEEIVKYLISEVKVDINCSDNEGKTPLLYALSWCKWSLAEYLLDSGADSNISDCKDKTPLMNAVEYKFWPFDTSPLPSQLDIVKKLISVSKDITTDINKSDHTGKTALHYAIEGKKWTAAEYLLKAGADRDISDNAGKTPLDYVTDADRLNHLKSIKTPSGDPIT